MHLGNLILVASITASALTGCGDSPQAPGTDDEVAALKQQTSPTVAIHMGPFVEGSGCSGFSSNWYSAAFDVNSDGIAVGSTGCLAGETLTFRWSELQGMEHLGHFEGGYPIWPAESINKSGTIAGVLIAGYITVPAEAYRPILWTASNSRIDLVPPTLCDPPEEWCAVAYTSPRINDNDVVAGTYLEGAYRWTAATGLVYLPILGARTPIAINSHGDILAGNVVLRKSGDLLEISGITPTSMNDKREIVGGSGGTAAKWAQGRGVEPLGTLGGTFSVAYDMNNRGEVVGASTNAAGEMRAFYWAKSRGMVDLGPGIAYAISDAGHMVGVGPSGLFAPENPSQEIMQAILWRGTGGVEPTAVTERVGGMQTALASTCFDDERNWQSKSRMLRCMAER